MKISKWLLSLSVLALAAGCVATVRPGIAGRHPAYLRALSDLRHARLHLERPANNPHASWDESVAIREIDAAIGDLSQAAADDGRNPYRAPPVDVAMDWRGRMHRSLELLEAARVDAAREEDNPYATGYRNNGIAHIDAAIAYVRQGIAYNQF